MSSRCREGGGWEKISKGWGEKDNNLNYFLEREKL
jgi:hypothetical protein